MRLAAAIFLLFASVVYGDWATWSAVGEAAEVRVEYQSFDGTICSCPFSGSTVCRPASASCFKSRVSVAVRVVDPPVAHLYPGASPLKTPIQGDCIHGDGFDAWPQCENLFAVLGPCAKQGFVAVATQFGVTKTTTVYSCAPGWTGRCLGIAGHLTPGIRLETIATAARVIYAADLNDRGGEAERLVERVAEEGCQ